MLRAAHPDSPRPPRRSPRPCRPRHGDGCQPAASSCGACRDALQPDLGSGQSQHRQLHRHNLNPGRPHPATVGREDHDRHPPPPSGSTRTGRATPPPPPMSPEHRRSMGCMPAHRYAPTAAAHGPAPRRRCVRAGPPPFRSEARIPLPGRAVIEAAAVEIGIDQGAPAVTPVQFGGHHGRHRAGAEPAADGRDRDQVGAQCGGGQRRRTNAPAAASGRQRHGWTVRCRACTATSVVLSRRLRGGDVVPDVVLIRRLNALPRSYSSPMGQCGRTMPGYPHRRRVIHRGTPIWHPRMTTRHPSDVFEAVSSNGMTTRHPRHRSEAVLS